MRISEGITVLTGLALVFSISPTVDRYLHADRSSVPGQEVPFFARFLGESRTIISSMVLEQADLYFHGGAGHEDHDCHIGILDMEEHDEGCGEAGEARQLPVFFSIREELNIGEHRHLKGDELKEIIPWLRSAFLADPRNVEAYVLTAYYLSDRLDRTEEALGVLMQGIQNNPYSWELNAETGRILLKNRKDPVKAIKYLSRAEKLLYDGESDKFQKRQVLGLLAHAYEMTQNTEKALPIYKRLQELFPGEKAYLERILRMEADQ